MVLKNEKALSQKKWKEFYEYLLDKGVATVDILQKKFNEYEKYKDSLFFGPNGKNLVNAQSALHEIFVERQLPTKEQSSLEETYER